MADFADTRAVAIDLEPAQARGSGRLASALPAGEQLLQSDLYSVCELVAVRGSSARQHSRARRALFDALRRA